VETSKLKADVAENGAAKTSDVLNVKSVAKAFNILEVFREGDTQMGLADLVIATGMDKSAVQRFTHTLKKMGYLEQDPATRRYSLGRRVLGLSFGYLRAQAVIERASPVLVDLRRELEERIDLTIPDGDAVLYVLRMQSKREHYMTALVGRSMPMFCSAGGRAMLACMPESQALGIVQRSDRRKFTASTLTDVSVIMKEIRHARTQGYALQESEWRPGEMVAAAAVKGKDGIAVAAVHVAVSSAEWTRAEMERRVVPLLLEATASIEGG
jgi:DNA-binding IclR family transcriptional regulator